MGLEEKNLDVLQNIEFAIVRVYQDRPTLRDHRVMNALDESSFVGQVNEFSATG